MVRSLVLWEILEYFTNQRKSVSPPLCTFIAKEMWQLNGYSDQNRWYLLRKKKDSSSFLSHDFIVQLFLKNRCIIGPGVLLSL